MAMIANAASSISGTIAKKKGKQFKIEDFMDKKSLNKLKEIGKEVRPKKDLTSYIMDAKAKGLRGPW